MYGAAMLYLGMKEIKVFITLCGYEGDPDEGFEDTLRVPYNATDKEVWDAARAKYGKYFYKVEGYPEMVTM